MSVYSIAVFLHIVSASALFAALGLEWIGLGNLRRAATVGQVREWLKPLTALRLVGGPAALSILVTGIYMSAVRWGEQGWIALGLVAMVLMAVLGATLTGRRVRALAVALPAEDGPITAALRHRVRDPVLRLSAWVRTFLLLGVVFIMTTKPDTPGALSSMGAALALGLAVGVSAWGRGRRSVPEGPGPLP